MSTLEHPITEVSSATAALKELIHSGRLAQALETEQPFAAADAYVHPNGFWKLRILGGSLEKLQVRLHYWPLGTGKGDIHDHGWAYASCALHGSAVEDVYEEGTGSVVTAHSYAPVDGDSFTLGWTSSETRLAHVGATIHTSGTYSGGDASHIHTFHAKPGTDLLTVVLTGEPVVSYSRVFLPGRGSVLDKIRPVPLSPEQIQFILVLAQTTLTA